MPELIVLAFDNMDEAEKVHHSMHAEDKIGYLDLKDSAVIVCDEDGKVNIKNEVSDGAKAGALWGGLIGILLAGFVFPLAVIAVSAVVGAFIGRSVTGDYVSKDFVNEVKEKLQPGTSAIFLIFRGSDVGHAIATLRPYKGTVMHTTLSDEAEKSLKDELKKRGTK